MWERKRERGCSGEDVGSFYLVCCSLMSCLTTKLRVLLQSFFVNLKRSKNINHERKYISDRWAGFMCIYKDKNCFSWSIWGWLSPELQVREIWDAEIHGETSLLQEKCRTRPKHNTSKHTNQCDNEETIKSSIKLRECEGAQLEKPDPGQSGSGDDMMQGAKQDAIH